MIAPGRFAIISFLLAILVGCSTLDSGTEEELQRAVAARANDEGYVLTPIADSRLPEGKCGMILWTLEQDRPAAVFRYVSEGNASLAINGAPVILQRTNAEGSQAFGVAENQSFSDETGLFDIEITAQLGLGFDGGVYLERGLITIENKDGWRTVTPVAGIAGCRG